MVGIVCATLQEFLDEPVEDAGSAAGQSRSKTESSVLFRAVSWQMRPKAERAPPPFGMHSLISQEIPPLSGSSVECIGQETEFFGPPCEAAGRGGGEEACLPAAVFVSEGRGALSRAFCCRCLSVTGPTFWNANHETMRSQSKAVRHSDEERFTQA
jgi:hypothetical protein